MTHFLDLQFNFLGSAHVGLQWAMALLLLGTFALVFKMTYQRLAFASAAHRIGVLTVNTWVFVCVFLLISELGYKGETIERAILITPTQTNTEQTLKWVNQIKGDSSAPVFVLQGVLKNKDNVGGGFQFPHSWQIIQQPEQIFAEVDSLQQLALFGDGLTQTQLNALQDLARAHFQHPLSIAFTPAPTLLGLVDMSWQRRLAVGEVQQISGQLQRPEGQLGIFDVALVSPSGETISRQQLADNTRFSFEFMTQTSGPQRYFLDLIDTTSKQVVKTESVTFDNYLSTPPKMLIRQSSPSFETRHIKNWATNFGSGVTVATQISQSTYISQHVNIEQENLPSTSDSQSATDWQNYDVMVIDGRALTLLTEPQTQGLYESIKAGLGILVIADESLVSDAGKNAIASWMDLSLVPLSDKTQNDQTHVFGHQFASQLPIPTYPAKIELAANGTELTELFRDKDDQPIVVSQPIGRGNIAVSLINSSYQWKLSSQISEFSRYWQTLILSLARPASTPYWLMPANTRLLTSYQGTSICAMLGHEEDYFSHYLSPDNTLVPIKLSESKINNKKQCGQFWPTDKGWYKFQLTQDVNKDTFYWFHHGNENWAAWRQFNKHQASSQQAAMQSNVVPSTHFVALNKLPIWATFILLITLLWVERKYYANPASNSDQ